MTVAEARRIWRSYFENPNPDEEDLFRLSEALHFLAEKTGNPDCMLDLGAAYYEKKRFGLALRYYEMAADRGSVKALSNLGYIWYYGRTGEVNYEKAFHCYDRARRAGDPVSAYKVADMYKNGYYVERDPEKYRAIIEGLYAETREETSPFAPRPEICVRLAGIRKEEGRTKEALMLYRGAREILARRIRERPFFGDLSIMRSIVKDVRELSPDGWREGDMFDLFALLAEPAAFRFSFEGKEHAVSSERQDDGSMAVCFDGKWFRTIPDFFMKAEVDGVPLVCRYEELSGFAETAEGDGKDRTGEGGERI